MILLAAALAFAADGDVLSGVTLGVPLETSSLTCRASQCQGRGEAAGLEGTLAVRRCHGVAKAAVVSQSFVASTVTSRRAFGPYMTFVLDAHVEASMAYDVARQWYTSHGWQVQDAHTDAPPWTRFVSVPHARVVRLTQREAAGATVWTVSTAAAATSTDCP